MLILQIILTIIAWRNGWKWKSLLPTGVVFLIAFFIGIGISIGGGTPQYEFNYTILDIISIIFLIIMSFVEPKNSKKEEIEKTTKLD